MAFNAIVLGTHMDEYKQDDKTNNPELSMNQQKCYNR